MSLNKLTKEALVELLGELIEKLDELDQEDFFGTEGWRHYLGIQELENSIKVNYECSSMKENKPVAYWDGKHFASKEKSSLADIPFYTHPHKELSDEEIWKIYNITGLGNGMAVRFAKAIIKASRGEE